MPNKDFFTLPFITRDQLALADGAQLDLEVVVNDFQGEVYDIIGLTRTSTFKNTVAGDGASTDFSTIFGLSDFPIYLTVVAEGTRNGLTDGRVTVYLRINGTRIIRMVEGYVTQTRSLGWPIAEVEDPLKTRGGLYEANPSNPAAGAEIGLTVSSGYFWKPKGLYFQLTTSATVASRRVHIAYKNTTTGKIMAEWAVATDQTAGTTKYYHLMPIPYLGADTDDDDIFGSMPLDVLLADNYELITSTTNLQTDDQFSDIRFTVEQYLK